MYIVYVIVAVYFTISCIETLIGHIMHLKGLIAAAFESLEPLHLLGVNEYVGAILT